MGLLDQYAKSQEEKEKKSVSIGTRIEKSLYNSYLEECQNLGLNKSEALRYLIIEFIRSAKDNDNSDEVNKSKTKVVNNEYNIIDEIRTEEKQKESKGNNIGKAGNVTKWVIDKKLPCPICGTWSSKPNFHRAHSSKHGYDNAFDFLNAYQDKVNEMLLERKSNDSEASESN